MRTPEEMLVRPDGPTFYEILGVDRTDTQHQIRAAYVALMKEFHPDVRIRRGQTDSRRPQLINEAFNTLKDPQRRARYDADLRYRRHAHGAGLSPTGSLATQGSRVSDRSSTRIAKCDQVALRPNRALAKGAILILLCATMVTLVVIFQQSRLQNPTRVSKGGSSEIAADALSRQPAILPAIIADSVSDFLWIRANGTAEDATNYSRNCFAQLREFPNLHLIDRCVAFDLARQSQLSPRRSGNLPTQTDQMSDWHRSILRQFSSDHGANEARLEAIGRVTTSELAFALRVRPGDTQPQTEPMTSTTEVSRRW